MINPSNKGIRVFFYPFTVSHCIMVCQLLSLVEYNRYWYRTEISWEFVQWGKNLNQIRISGDLVRYGSPIWVLSWYRLLLCVTVEVHAEILHKAMLYYSNRFPPRRFPPKRQGFDTSLLKTMYTLRQTHQSPRSAQASRWINKASR